MDKLIKDRSARLSAREDEGLSQRSDRGLEFNNDEQNMRDIEEPVMESTHRDLIRERHVEVSDVQMRIRDQE